MTMSSGIEEARLNLDKMSDDPVSEIPRQSLLSEPGRGFK